MLVLSIFPLCSFYFICRSFGFTLCLILDLTLQNLICVWIATSVYGTSFILGLGVGSFTDIEGLTMFADYRVPQSLQQYKVLMWVSIVCSPPFRFASITITSHFSNSFAFTHHRGLAVWPVWHIYGIAPTALNLRWTERLKLEKEELKYYFCNTYSFCPNKLRC